ncbi:hypothetical protein [Marinobacter xestospongiae]|uniref:Papain-like cysteine peptidase n=1 Tax=Marinobacter xestospongiae TaxID=994319 RepID=A0ABU3W1R7_9GAMM|nr:hypothetical protein [Marinobacter xestospongiae]MDV2080356.1 hypothetical protein [Marinobacter xestospongiae]
MKFSESTNRKLLFRESNKKVSYSKKTLKEMPQLKIQCGKYGGLPFNYLMTDVVSGCLSVTRMCYGNCSAFEYWTDSGYDFGRRRVNILDLELFDESVRQLPADQKWLRQGWASDCSLSNESWELVALLAERLNQFGISLLIITKIWCYPSITVLKRLAKSKAEIRVSVSAFDSDKEIKKRLRLLEEYRDLCGISVMYIMSCIYDDNALNKNQDYLVHWTTNNDFIGAEHPLRLSFDNYALSVVSKNGFWHEKFPDQYWFGRILHNVPNFALPPPTCLTPSYSLNSRFFSELEHSSLKTYGNLPTFEDLKNNVKNHLIYSHATYNISKTQYDE